MSEKKKYSELVLEERKKGNVVCLVIDSIMSAPVKDIIKQPVDGLLWDLNRDEVTALTFMDQEGMIHWVNNFAVALVIRELKSQLTQLEARLEDEEGLKMQAVQEWNHVEAENERLLKLETEIKKILTPDPNFKGTLPSWEPIKALLTGEDNDD